MEPVTGHLPQLLDIDSARRALGLSRSRIYELIRIGKVRVVRLGPRGMRVPVSELRRIEKDGISEE